MFQPRAVAKTPPSAYLTVMANGLRPLAGLCALYLLGAGCSSDHDQEAPFVAGMSAGGMAGQSSAGRAGAGTASDTATSGGTPTAAGASGTAGPAELAGSAGQPQGGEGSRAPAAVSGQSIYALECHGDSKDCHQGTVPCFGVSSPSPDVPAGWACANRCTTSADCSDAPTGAEAKASCVPFTSTGHCVLVCKNENKSFSCPDGMSCYVPERSPIGYCLWP